MRSAPDFLNDNAVVLFAFAVADTCFQHGGVDFEKRQLLSDLTRLIHHQLRVFKRLPDAAFRSKITGDHFRPFGVHHLRSGCRRACYFKERGRIKTQPRGKHQAFG